MWEQSTLWIEHLNDWFVSLFSDKMHPLLKEVNVYSRENHGLEMQLNSFIFPLLRPRGKHYKELKEREKNKTVLSLKKRAVFLVSNAITSIGFGWNDPFSFPSVSNFLRQKTTKNIQSWKFSFKNSSVDIINGLLLRWQLTRVLELGRRRHKGT